MSKIIGITGWKDVGKTYYASLIIKSLVKKGYKVGSIKHAHHDFDIDKPGTDSFKHREAGSSQVIISSSKRWAKITENNNGVAGGTRIVLRGNRSISGNNQALIIIDGIEATLDEVDPNDIKSVSVLKDASASIYGSRAGNGVIIIKTKRGKN